MTGHYPGRVPPFGYPWINAYLRLPTAFRSLSRPSSAISALASTLRSYSLDLCRRFRVPPKTSLRTLLAALFSLPASQRSGFFLLIRFVSSFSLCSFQGALLKAFALPSDPSKRYRGSKYKPVSFVFRRRFPCFPFFFPFRLRFPFAVRPGSPRSLRFFSASLALLSLERR